MGQVAGAVAITAEMRSTTVMVREAIIKVVPEQLIVE